MNNNLLKYIFLVLIIVASACKKQPATTTQPVTVIPKKESVDVNNLKFDYFSTRAKINLEDKDNKIAGKVTIRIRRDSLIWMSVTPGLGIEAMRAKITKDSVYIINYLEKTYKVYDFNYVNNLLNMELNYDVLQSLIVGNLPFGQKDTDELEKDSTGILLKQNTGVFSIDNVIESKNRKVKKIKITDKPSKSVFHIEYTDFQPLDAELFPFTSNINLQYRKGQIFNNAKILINHIKAEISNNELTFPFAIPAKYESK